MSDEWLAGIRLLRRCPDTSTSVAVVTYVQNDSQKCLLVRGADGLLLIGAQFRRAAWPAAVPDFPALAEAFNAFLQLVVRHAIFGMHLVEGRLIHGQSFRSAWFLALAGSSLRGKSSTSWTPALQSAWERWSADRIRPAPQSRRCCGSWRP